MRRLRGAGYDLSLELAEGDRGAFLSWISKARTRVGFRPSKPRLRARAFHLLADRPDDAGHMVESFLRQTALLGIAPQDASLKFEPGSAARQRAGELLAGAEIRPGSYALLHPTSRWMFKSWTPAGNAALIRHLAGQGLKVVLTSGPDPKEMALVERIRDLTPPGAITLDLAGNLDLYLLGGLIASARVFAGVDSAPMHMAAALGVPVLTIFGPSGEHMWGPWQAPAEVLVGDCPDHPCGRSGCDGSKVRPLPGGDAFGAGVRGPGPAPGKDGLIMRLGLIRLKYDQTGGAERTLEMLARGLLARGHEVWVITSSWQGEPPQGLRLSQVPLGSGGREAWAQAVRRAMEELKLDTCLSLERVPGAPVFRAGDGCHAAWLERRAPYEGLLKRLSFGLNPKHRKLLALERATLSAPQLRLVIAGSRMVAQELERLYQVPQDKIRVISNGVDRERLAPARSLQTREQARQGLGLEPGRPALLFLGGGWERKGLAFALAALARVPEAVLLVAGRDRPRPWLAQAKRLGVEPRVKLLGQRNDVPALLAAADALVLPTIYDPCSNACLEAIYAGLPVVTTSANGAAQFIEPGVNGVVVEQPSDAPALASAMESALSLERGSGGGIAGMDEWLERIMGVLEESARPR